MVANPVTRRHSLRRHGAGTESAARCVAGSRSPAAAHLPAAPASVDWLVLDFAARAHNQGRRPTTCEWSSALTSAETAHRFHTAFALRTNGEGRIVSCAMKLSFNAKWRTI